MIQLHRIEYSGGIDLKKTGKSKECKICYYNYFKNYFKSDSTIWNDCDWGIKYFGNFAIMHVNSFAYRFFMFNMTKEDVVEFIKDFEPNYEFETIDMNKTSLSRKCLIFHYCTLKILVFTLSQIFVINVMVDVSFYY